MNPNPLWSTCGCAITLGLAMPADAAFVVSGGARQGLPIAGNDFNADLASLSIDTMTSGAQLRVNQDGFVDFAYIGAESGFTDTFTSGAHSVTEHDEGFNPSGYSTFTVAVSAGDILNFNFTSSNPSALSPVDNFSGSNLQGMGIFHDSGQADPTQVVLAYDDQKNNDDNDYDDMLIRADFRPGLPVSDVGASIVPLPAAAWLFGAGLIGLIGFARRETV